MSQKQSSSDLKRRHDEAWKNLKVYIYETYEPRFYKRKVGRKSVYLNPWKDLPERIAAEARIRELWLVWNEIHGEYVQTTGDHPKLPSIYIEKETPDGLRWVKEAAAAS